MRSRESTARECDLRGRRPEFAEILPDLAIGEYPRVEDLLWLKTELGISAVLSLQDDDDLAHKGVSLARLVDEARRLGLELRRWPIADGDAEALERALDAVVADLQSLLQAGHRVFLHCNAGYNRAPTVAIAYLCAYRGAALRDAIAATKERRACVPFTSVLARRFG